MPVDLFTYGVLMYSELFRALTGKRAAAVPAALHHFQRYSLEKEGWSRVPVAVEEPGVSIQGVLVRDVDEATVELLDDFEDVQIGLYVRETVKVVDASEHEFSALAYVAGPEAIGCLSGIWSPEQFMEEHYDDYREHIIPNFLRDR